MSRPPRPSAPSPARTARPLPAAAGVRGSSASPAPFESDLGLDLAPLQKELARHAKAASRGQSRVSHHSSQSSLDTRAPAAFHFPSVRDATAPPLHHRPAANLPSPPLSSSDSESCSGSDTETEGGSEAYEHVPRYELQAMLREAKRVIRQRERDLELAARVGTALVNRNLNLSKHGRQSHPHSHSRSTSTTSHAHHSSVAEAERFYHHGPLHHHSHSQSYSYRRTPRPLSDLFDPSSPLPSPRLPPSAAAQDQRLLRHASSMSTDSTHSTELHTHDYFGSLGRSHVSNDRPKHGVGLHSRSVSDLSPSISEQSNTGFPATIGDDDLVSLSPYTGRDPIQRMPEHASFQFDDDEVTRAHAREMETQRRLASLTEENSVLLERLTQLQSDTERNHRDGGRKLRSLDHELQQLRDELDAVMDRNAELERQGKVGFSFEKHSPVTPDRPERPHGWHHRPLIASLDSLPNLEGQLSLVHTPPEKHAQMAATPSLTSDRVEPPGEDLNVSPAVTGTPSKHQGEKDAGSEESHDSVPMNPEGMSRIAVELQEAALRKLTQGKRNHSRHASSASHTSSHASHACHASQASESGYHASHATEAKANQEEINSLVKRLLTKIDELEQTNLQMTREGYDMDGRLGQAIEANERLRDAYGAIEKGRDSFDFSCPGTSGPELLPLDEPRTRQNSERGAGNRYAIAARRLVNDVLDADLGPASSSSDGQAPQSEAETELVVHLGPTATADTDTNRVSKPDLTPTLANFPDDGPGDSTMQVMDMLREIEELRLENAGLEAIQEHGSSGSATELDTWQAEAEDDIALVETGDTSRRTTVEGGEDEDDDNRNSAEYPLRSFLQTEGEGDAGGWFENRQILPLGALREPTVGTTADGYEMISEATKRRPLLWADDEDYGKPITLQQAADFGLINAPGSRGLVGSGWMIFVALRRALGLLPYNERKRVTSTVYKRNRSRVLGASSSPPQMRIQSTDQLEAEAELRRVLHQRRIEFEEAVLKMRHHRRLSSSTAAPSRSSTVDGRTHSSTLTSPSTASIPIPLRHERDTLSALPQLPKYHDKGKGRALTLPAAACSPIRPRDEIVVADLPDYHGRPNTSLSYASTEWVVDEVTDRMYVKMPKPKSRSKSVTGSKPLSAQACASSAPNDRQPDIKRGKSFLLQAVSDSQAMVASAKTRVDTASNEVATMLSTWATFTSIILCAGVYMFSHGPRRVLNNAAEPNTESVVSTLARKATG